MEEVERGGGRECERESERESVWERVKEREREREREREIYILVSMSSVSSITVSSPSGSADFEAPPIALPFLL